MKKTKLVAFLLAAVLLLVPTPVLAVEFTIPEVMIDAQLNEDGSADVVEQHTYEFEGDFEGLTRGLSAKEGTSITDFKAFEDGDELRVEQEDGVYRIYRAGEDETVTVEMHYRITDGVEKFEDGAEFYWPFFDDRNESDYGDMIVTITPPAPADDVQFLGYDEAYGTASLISGGAVEFQMGEVPEGRKGDVRVVFEPELFPDVPVQNGTIRDKVTEEQQRLEEEAALFAANRQTARDIGNIAVPTAAGAVALLFGASWFRVRRNKRKADIDGKEFFVPKQKMSIPATIYFTKSPFLGPNVTAAALLDLIRKGHVEQLAEDHFRVVNRQTEFTHEAALITLLFDEVGDGTSFTLAELESYTKDDSNHETYNELITEWNQGIAGEVKARNLYHKNPGLRWTTAFFALPFGAAAVFFGWYELYPFMAFSIALALACLAFAAFHQPRTVEGHTIRKEWQELSKAMEDLPSHEWDKLTRDEKLRAYTYALGVENKNFEQKANAFSLAGTGVQSTDAGGLFTNPVFLAAVFMTASSNTTAHASGSSMPGGGGGVGGGGGGSGAF